MRQLIQWLGLLAGPVFAYITYQITPESVGTGAEAVVLGHAGRATLAAMVWMATWWLTEATHVTVTALLPLVIFPLMGVGTMKETAGPYASDIIYLFMGGFLLALSMQRWKLDKRIALFALKLVGTRPRFILAGFMVITAVLSAFVSNTATAAMMMPIAISIIALAESGKDGASRPNFAVCLMLGIAYAASIGGIATIIGSPPNSLLVAYVKDSIASPYRMEVSYAKWMQIGVPVVLVMLPFTWWFLSHVLFRINNDPIEGGRRFLNEEWKKLGPLHRGEWVTMIVFSLTVILWLTRKPLTGVFPVLAPLTDSGVAMMGAFLLFIIPVDWKKREFTMNWETAQGLPWGILILFGGGLTLASAVKQNSVAEFLGTQATGLAGIPPFFIILAVVAAVVFLTELTSNTATTATLLPVLAGIAPALDMHPYLLIFPTALAASMAFMMPVATPPNAIVFGTGRVTLPQMVRAGVGLNFIGIIVLMILNYLLISKMLGVG